MSSTLTPPPGVAPPAIQPPRAAGGIRLTGIQPDEFLFPGSSVVVEAAQPIDVESALKTIGVPRADNHVEVGGRGRRATWRPPEGLRPGRHVLQLGPILSAKGEEIAPAMAVPFHFVRPAGRIPDGVSVESVMRLRMTPGGLQRLPLQTPVRGKFVELVKGTNRRTSAPVALAFDETGKKVDERRVLATFEKRRAKRLGKLHPDLHARMQGGRPDERLHVAVWVHADEIRPDDKRGLEREVRDARDPEPPGIVGERGRAMIARTRKIAGIAQEMGAREMRVDDAAPVVFARLPKRAIQRLAAREEVAAVFLYDPEGIEDLTNSIAIANSDDVHTAGTKGSGVKVAVWENGPTSTAELVIEDRYTSSPSTSDHSEHVHGIIKNKESGKPKGHAPECTLHSANSKDLDALRWAVKDKGCTVINQSFHRSSEPKSGDLSFDDVYKDWLALNWPYPTICQAAGNFWNGDPDNVNPPSDEFVNHKGYNSLAIANHDDSAAAISSDSVFRNPSSSHGDRELPELGANGTSVTTVGFTKSGTSMASPAAAGVAALLQSASGTLKSWPEGCRAILLAGATKNVTGETWWRDVVDDDDGSDGSGAVNAYESHQIAKNRRSRNAAATRRGWDVGTLQSSDFDSNGLSTFVYRVHVPRLLFGPRRVKVALAWDSKVTTLSLPGITLPLSSRLTVDLDLKVFDRHGAQVGYSGSWDNSYEVAEFEGVPGETYDIRIRRWSGTDWTWYGIAWTVTGSMLVLEAILAGGATRVAAAAASLPRFTDE